MNKENITTELFMMGLPGLGGFIFILLAYAMTMFLDIIYSMYFFLKNFLISEMFLGCLTVPFMLHVIWMEGAAIMITGCITQNYLSVASGSCECYLLTAMSYDRYLVICKPLHYNKLMSNSLQCYLVVFCWLIGFLGALILLSLLMELKFCGQNVIDHFICDHANLTNLACSDTTAVRLGIFVMTFPIVVFPFVLIIVSYMSIFGAILRMSSVTGRKKAFCTCSSHLLVVALFYGILIMDYFIAVRGNLGNINKISFFIFIVMIPLFNPIIYSLRNQDIRAAIKRYICRWP